MRKNWDSSLFFTLSPFHAVACIWPILEITIIYLLHSTHVQVCAIKILCPLGIVLPVQWTSMDIPPSLTRLVPLSCLVYTCPVDIHRVTIARTTLTDSPIHMDLFRLNINHTYTASTWINHMMQSHIH